MALKHLLRLALVTALLVPTSCTKQSRARNWGRSSTIKVEAGQKIINVTWKEDDLWVWTRDMKADERPEISYLREYSSYGVLEGKIELVESAAPVIPPMLQPLPSLKNLKLPAQPGSTLFIFPTDGHGLE